MKDGKALEPDDPFPEDRLQIELIKQGDEAWEWMDYLRSRIRIARAMTALPPVIMPPQSTPYRCTAAPLSTMPSTAG